MVFPDLKTNTDTELAVMGSQMKMVTKSIENHIKEQKEDFKEVHVKLDGLIDKLDKKYANKWVEKALIVVITGVTIGLIVFIATGG